MESTTIYFIGSLESGTVKIGKSNNPRKRLDELQIGNPYKLVLYAVINDVSQAFENRLHNLFDHLRINGEWFKLTDELVQFMINKTDDTSFDYKVNVSKTNYDPLDDAIDNIVKFDKDGKDWMSEDHLIMVIRNYLRFIRVSPHFDVKKLRRKLENRGIYKSKKEGQWIYLDYYVDEKVMHPDHYIGSDKIVDVNDRMRWDLEWESKCSNDGMKFRNINFSMGYSYIESFKDGPLTVTTITTTASGIEVPVIIYKYKLYDASCVTEIIKCPSYYKR
jgi:hypothetical protein